MTIADGGLATDQKTLDKVLEPYARKHRKGRDAEHAPPEDDRRDDQRRHERDDDVAHDPARGLHGLHVRSGSDDKFVSHIIISFFTLLGWHRATF